MLPACPRHLQRAPIWRSMAAALAMRVLVLWAACVGLPRLLQRAANAWSRRSLHRLDAPPWPGGGGGGWAASWG